MESFISFELGGTHLRFGIVQGNLDVLVFDRMATSILSEAPNKISFFSSIIHDLIEKYKPEKIAAITFALSSLLDRERTYVYSSPMVKGFDNIPLKSELEREFTYPIILEKDVNILQLYEIYKRQLPREGIVTGFYLGTGLGNSISIDGKVYVGNTGSACELGHMPLYGSTEICGCGKKGCIELKACGRVLEHLAEKIFHCPVREIFQQYGSTSEIKEIIEYFALAIATEIGILDPRCVVLGGGVVDMPGFPKDLLITRIRSHVRTPYPRESLEFIFASGDTQAGIVGAVIHAKNKLHLF